MRDQRARNLTMHYYCASWSRKHKKYGCWLPDACLCSEMLSSPLWRKTQNKGRNCVVCACKRAVCRIMNWDWCLKSCNRGTDSELIAHCNRTQEKVQKARITIHPRNLETPKNATPCTVCLARVAHGEGIRLRVMVVDTCTSCPSGSRVRNSSTSNGRRWFLHHYTSYSRVRDLSPVQP